MENAYGMDATTPMIITVTDATGEQPTACFVTNTQMAEVGEAITFDASCSQNAVNYRWDFDCDGIFETGSSSEEIVSYAYDASGNYVAKLQVENAYGVFDTQTIEIIIDEATTVPAVACFVMNTNEAMVNEPIQFDASCSEDAAIYKWDFNSDGIFEEVGSDKAVVIYSYIQAGTNTVNLEVESSDRISDATTMPIQINAATPITPTACFVASESSCTIDCIVNFDASCSEDAVMYRWDFDNDGVFDESGSEAETVSHTYTEVENYSVRLQVESSDGTIDEIIPPAIQVVSCLECPEDIEPFVATGDCFAPVSWVLPTTLYDCSILSSSHNPGDIFFDNLTTTVTYTADNGTTCSFTVTLDTDCIGLIKEDEDNDSH